jgi:IS5 family transposase
MGERTSYTSGTFCWVDLVSGDRDASKAFYRVGAEERISHLKRGYGMRRTRPRGQPGARTTVGWSILT